MTELQFKIHFKRFIEAFSVTQPEKKAGIYFEMLQRYSDLQMNLCTNEWIRTGTRFPLLSDLLKIMEAKFPPRITNPLLPSKDEIKQKWGRSTVSEFEQALLKHAMKKPLRFLKGFKRTQWILKKNAPEKWEAAQAVLKDLVGERRFREVMGDPGEMGKRVE